MQIIEIGHVQPKTVICSDCSAKLAFLKNDIRLVGNYTGFNCPCCGYFILMREYDGQWVQDPKGYKW